jgi:hypothetical protein
MEEGKAGEGVEGDERWRCRDCARETEDEVRKRTGNVMEEIVDLHGHSGNTQSQSHACLNNPEWVVVRPGEAFGVGVRQGK